MKPSPAKLRFGIILDSFPYLKAWQKTTLEKLLDSDLVELVLVIESDDQSAGRVSAAHHQHAGIIWKVLSKILERLTRKARFHDTTKRLDGCRRLRLGQKRDSPDLAGEYKKKREETARHRLDFLLDFTQGAARHPALPPVRYGIWSYCHGTRQLITPAPPCFGEIVNAERITASILYARFGTKKPSVCLFEGKLKTGLNYLQTLNAALSAGTDWPLRICKEIYQNSEAFKTKKPLPERDQESSSGPTNWQTMRFIWQHLRNLIDDILDELFYFDIWNVGIIDGQIENIRAMSASEEIRWLPPREPLAYSSDPFFYTLESKPYLLVENYSHRRNEKGQIYRISLDHKEENKLEPVITGAHHFSYPYTLTVAGQTYCIPESYQKRQCRLYRLSPEGHFVFERILIDKIGVLDPTLFFHDGFWWLFFNDIEAGNNTVLFAYYATEFDAEFCPHALNPLKCDVTSSRPAGRPFTRDGLLYRPAQDCSRTYGGAITINEVRELSPQTFEEKAVFQILPKPDGPYPDGIHHIEINDNTIVFDSKKRIFDLWFKLKQLGIVPIN